MKWDKTPKKNNELRQWIDYIFLLIYVLSSDAFRALKQQLTALETFNLCKNYKNTFYCRRRRVAFFFVVRNKKWKWALFWSFMNVQGGSQLILWNFSCADGKKAHRVEQLKKRPDLPHGNRETKLHLGNIIYAIYFLIQFYYISSSSSAAAVPSLFCSHLMLTPSSLWLCMCSWSRVEKTFQIFSPRARFVSLLSRKNICTRIKFDVVDGVSSTCIVAFLSDVSKKSPNESGNQEINNKKSNHVMNFFLSG